MSDDHYQMVGLAGFILAGLIFIAVGLRSEDVLTVVGSIVWTLSCIVWLIPLMRRR